MQTDSTGAKINVVTAIVVKTLVTNPLAVTAVFCSRDNAVIPQTITGSESSESVSLELTENFNPESDYLVALTRSGDDGQNCQYMLLAGVAPTWLEYPEKEDFNLLGGSDRMDPGHRRIVALPLRFVAERLAREKPRV